MGFLLSESSEEKVVDSGTASLDTSPEPAVKANSHSKLVSS